MAGFQLEGLDEVLKKMDEMTKNIQKKHLKKALREGAKIVQKSAKENAQKINDPKTSADMERHLYYWHQIH